MQPTTCCDPDPDRPATSVITRSCSHEKPRWTHLFIFTTRKHTLLLFAAIVTSMLAGALETFLSILLGEVFSVISGFGAGALSVHDTIGQISTWCGILTAVAGVGWLVNCLFFYSWVAFGELQAQHARQQLFSAFLQKKMEWYDRRIDGCSSLVTRCQTCAFQIFLSCKLLADDQQPDQGAAICNL